MAAFKRFGNGGDVFRGVAAAASGNVDEATVGDNVVVVVPSAVPLPGFDAKGPVPLLFVRPYIWIGEEEAAAKKQK